MLLYFRRESQTNVKMSDQGKTNSDGLSFRFLMFSVSLFYNDFGSSHIQKYTILKPNQFTKLVLD